MKRLLPIACLITTALAGQGYDKTTWGMTKDQVKAVYKKEKLSTAEDGSIAMPRQVAGVPCIVTFEFAPKLSMVRVKLDDDTDPYAPLEERLSRGRKIGTLLRALEDKYGPGEDRNGARVWSQKGTTVRWVSLAMTPTWHFVEAQYTPRQKGPGSGL